VQKIYLVRHGQTDWNLEMRFQGKEKIPINETGKNQARLLSQRLSKEEFTAVYSSPLLRARETAEIIAGRHGLTPHLVVGIREICFGCWEGKTYSEMNEKEQNDVDRWLLDPENSSISGGETFKHFKERILQSYKELLSINGRNFVLVSHAGAIKVLVADILGLPFSRIASLKLSLCSLSVLLYDDCRNAYLELFNDTCHLAK
jgi:alpha-ribazole phosphatase/probable phosphoglycerate mutase